MKPVRVFAFVSMLVLPCAGKTTFKKAEVRTSYGMAEQGENGSPVVQRKPIAFHSKGMERFTIPSDAVTKIFYSRVSGRRIRTAMVVSPWLLLTKGRKHYLTVSFNDGANLTGAVEFQKHKSNYRGALRSLEQVTGVVSKYDQEGVSAGEQTLASRSELGLAPIVKAQGVLSIESTPPGAEVYIDGQFNGLTPRKKVVAPGTYLIRVEKRGMTTEERTLVVEPSETAVVSIELAKP